MRIAILGGSFDPIHNGHLQIAKYAKRHLPIDEVWFMPTFDTPLKEKKLTEFYKREQMVRLAIRPYRYMKVCSLEAECSMKSYTIDTVKKLQKKFTKFSFCWLIGTDQATQLSKWKDIDALMELIPFYVFTREEVHVDSSYPLRFVQMPLIEVSSTKIREGAKLWMVPKKVRQYIGNHHLYIETMVQNTMNEHRYKHCLSVAELSAELARIHHLDIEKAYLAGLLHDVCKPWDETKARIWMMHLEPSLLQEHPAIWHGYIASKYVKRYYKIEDKEILFAIRHHVKGTTKSKLAMIVYIADKLDPLRAYDSSETILLCKQNLHAGYQEVMRQQEMYLSKSIQGV